MNKEGLAKAIYDVHGGLSQADCLRIVDFIIATIRDRVSRGEKVLLSGFGCVRVKTRKDRRGVNPQTGEGITIPGRKAVVFTPSRHLKSMP